MTEQDEQVLETAAEVEEQVGLQADPEPASEETDESPAEAKPGKYDRATNWLMAIGVVWLIMTKPALAAAIALFGVLVAIHEAGHMMLAKWSGMRVERFSIGMGPALYSFKRGETEYVLAPLPLGGYVHIAGLDPEEEGAADDPRAFDNRPLLGRVLAILGGPLANYVSAGLLVFLLGVSHGGRWAVMISAVSDDGAAAQAGVQSGDLLLAIDGEAVNYTSDLPRLAAPANDYTLSLRRTIVLDEATDLAALPGRRSGDVLQAINGELTWPQKLPAGEHQIEFQRVMTKGDGLFGLRPESVPVRGGERSLGGALAASVQIPYETTKMMAMSLYGLMAKPNSATLEGPVGILRQAQASADAGVLAYLMFAVTLSVVLGFFNLLPIPALDGGRLVFLFLEAVHSKLVPSPKTQAKIHGYGFLVLLTLILVVTVNDVGRIFGL
ncbi:MAG: hypothetical protein CMH55_04055 [Myxococcales bacterium]|nr:hypothetical protein [Myxococcales bacterium]